MSKRAGDLAARLKAAATGPAEPTEAPTRRQRRAAAAPAPPSEGEAPPRRRSTRQQPAPAPQQRQRRQAPAAPELAGFNVRGPGGKRTVLYLPADVLDHLAAIQRAAETQGGRLDRSAIVAQLVRRHRDGR